MPESPCDLDATDLADLIAGKQISPVEVMRAYLERIATLNPRHGDEAALLRLGMALERFHDRRRLP